MMTEKQVLEYIQDVLDDDILSLEDVLEEISKAPLPIKRYLRHRCRKLEAMEEFLRNHYEHFMVENGKVAVNERGLKEGRKNAVAYFEDNLISYDENPHYMNFRGHVGQADTNVIRFINNFYPGEEFKDFLLEHEDVFAILEDDSVCLVEVESVDYFEHCVKDYGEGLSVTSLRGHIGQAPDHVINFINTYYPGEKFLEFLEINSDVFHVEVEGVYLTADD